MSSAFFDPVRNREEFVARHGFDPRELEWEPVMSFTDRRDNRDPSELGAKILAKVRRWPSTGVCTHADRVLA